MTDLPYVVIFMSTEHLKIKIPAACTLYQKILIGEMTWRRFYPLLTSKKKANYLL